MNRSLGRLIALGKRVTVFSIYQVASLSGEGVLAELQDSISWLRGELEEEHTLSNSFQDVLPTSIVQFLPGPRSLRRDQYKAIYEANRHRVYSFAFWMTDSELSAEQLSERTFLRAFSLDDQPTDEMIDRALLRELQSEAISLGPLQLRCAMVHTVGGVRRNTHRIELERAIMQLPYTERMIFCMHDGDGYDHARIARTLDISEHESIEGLHQARLRIRELVSSKASRVAA